MGSLLESNNDPLWYIGLRISVAGALHYMRSIQLPGRRSNSWKGSLKSKSLWIWKESSHDLIEINRSRKGFCAQPVAPMKSNCDLSYWPFYCFLFHPLSRVATMLTDDEYDYLFKLVLIGDSGVGKSNLLSRFTVSGKEKIDAVGGVGDLSIHCVLDKRIQPWIKKHNRCRIRHQEHWNW